MPTIFYSWQTDAPSNLNRTFIEEALVEAAAGMNVEPAERLAVDEGMQDTPGSPEIARVLFEKIESAFLFVGDVTLVGQLPGGGRMLTAGAPVTAADTLRRTPNPNVAVELGYADAALGWQRVLRVMNTAFGKPEDQPFDVRNRRFPIRYNLKAEATEHQRNQVKANLVGTFVEAIAAAEAFQLRRAGKARDLLDVHTAEMMVHFGHAPWEFPQPGAAQPGAAVPCLRDLELFNRCTVRLLELGIIRTNLGLVGGQVGYSYRWTPFGKKVHALIPVPGA